MNKYQFISSNQEVVKYVVELAEWIEKNSHCSSDDIEYLITKDIRKIRALFESSPETTFHHDSVEEIQIPASKILAFKPGKELKEAVK